MRITVANLGNYSVCFKTIFENLGAEGILPEKTSPRAIEEGAKLSPELFCFPLKVNIGNYLTAIRKGADTIFMWENIGGSCRLRYYWQIQEKILREAGYNVTVLNLNAKNLFPRINEVRKKNNISIWQTIKAFLFFLEEMRFIEKLEEKTAYLRPREKKKGGIDQILVQAIEKMDKIKNSGQLNNFKKEVWEKLSKIEINKNAEVLRIGLVGEIYTVIDGAINLDLEKRLGQMGVEVHRQMNLFYHLKKTVMPWIDWKIQRKIMPYLESTVGGHGRDAIYELLEYSKEGFDGVIQLLPFGCFLKDTGITTENYLQKTIQDIKIGDKVLTHKGRFKKVTKTFCRDYQGEILKVDCGGKLKLEITPDHPILLAKSFIKNHKRIINNLRFTPINEAEKGDFIAIPVPKLSKEVQYLKWDKEYKREPKWEEIRKFPYSPDLLRLIGYWLAEGNIQYDTDKNKNGQKYPRGLVFNFSPKETNYIKDVANIIDKNFDARVSQYYYPEKRPNNFSLNIGNRNLADIVYCLCGEHCDKKVLHSDLIHLKPDLQKNILKGFFRGDGGLRDMYGETTYRAVTTSENLANQLFWLLIRNRIKTSFSKQNINNRKLSWMLKISNAQGIKKLNDEFINITNRKNNVRFRESRDYFLVPIRKIDKINFKGEVYNLEIEDDHSYVANFLAVHNCMPETTVRPILQKISQEKKIPFISFSLDEQTGEVGITTRIEAFVDLIKSRQKYNIKK
jgi:predicted nucleotide-binding protein (sugar kinase/HSP70/actin superfamily)/intein/homing endonuclease